MGAERKSDEDSPPGDAQDQDAKHKRQLLRAAEAFRGRAEVSQRRWLAALRVKRKDRKR